MSRARFSERQTIASLIWQGIPVTCFRTKQPITLENVNRLEREHLVELGLVAPEDRRKYDSPEYCRYSLREAHALITNGNGATSAGSSKHRVAKARRMEKARLAETSGQVGEDKPKRKPIVSRPLRGRSAWPESKRKLQSHKFDASKYLQLDGPRPSRKLQSRPFPKPRQDAAE